MSDEKTLQDLTSELKSVVNDAVSSAKTLADHKQAIENISSDETIKAKVDEAVKASSKIAHEDFKSAQVTGEGRFKSYGDFLASKSGDEEVKELQNMNDNLMISAGALAKAKNVSVKRAMEMMQETKAYKDFGFRVKDLTTGGSGTGAEWIPTGFSTTLYEDVRSNLTVAANIPTFSAPTNPFSWPAMHGVGTALKATAEASAYTEGDPTTAKVTFDCEKAYGFIQVSDEFTADSAFAVAPALRSSLTRRLGEGLENCVINGDRADSTHFDTDVSTASSVQKLFNGLRYEIHAAGASATATNSVNAGGAAISASDVLALRKLMGKYGNSDTALVVSISAYCDLLADSDVTTVDKLGANATILSGQLASVWGIPILVSNQVKTNLAADGMYDGVTTNLQEAILFNRQSFMLAERGGLKFETQRVVASGADDLVLSGRWDMQSFAPSGGVNCTVVLNAT